MFWVGGITASGEDAPPPPQLNKSNKEKILLKCFILQRLLLRRMNNSRVVLRDRIEPPKHKFSVCTSLGI